MRSARRTELGFFANSLVLLLIGMHEVRQDFMEIWLRAVIAIALVALGRAITIYPCCFLFLRSSHRVTMKHQNILLWGG
jgi:CPA1 family monovalent cation:H+ antiporter